MSDYQGAEGWDVVQAGLAAVLTDHGRRLSEDAGRLRAALSDQLGASGQTYRGLVDALVVAAEEHVPADLIAGAAGQPARPYAELLAALTERGFGQPMAATVIERWRAALAPSRPNPPAPAPAATAPPIVVPPPVVPPPPVVSPVASPVLPPGARTADSAPTHLANPVSEPPWTGPGTETRPTATPSASRRYAVLFVASLVLIAVVGALLWFTHRDNGTAGPGSPSASAAAHGLTAPAGLSASGGPGTVALSWQSVAGATRYVVTRDGSTVSTANLTATLFTDTVSDTDQHAYTVAAVGPDGPGPASTVTATAGAVIPSTGPSSTGTAAAEAALVAALPTSAVDTATCKSYPSGEGEGADASVTCDSAGSEGSPPSSIFAYHYVSAAAQQADTTSSIDLEKLTAGDCRDGLPAADHWHIGEQGPRLGALLCYDYQGTAVVRWDYDDRQVSVEGWASGGTLPQLMKWWLASAGPLR